MFDTKTAAAKLGVSPESIKKWMKAGKISYTKVGRLNRFTEDDLKSVMVRKEITADTPCA